MALTQYNQRPPKVYAVQLRSGTNRVDIEELLKHAGVSYTFVSGDHVIDIQTLEGSVRTAQGQWLVSSGLHDLRVFDDAAFNAMFAKPTGP